MNKEKESFKINIKSGKMYIGDLCYALRDDIYDNVWGKQNQYNDGAYQTPEGDFAMVGTAYGDGSYLGSDGMEYPVDAGIIGICDMALVDKDVHGLGTVVEADGEANISYENGTIAITYNNNGATKFVDIETAEDYEDEEDEDYYEYDEEEIDESKHAHYTDSLIESYLTEAHYDPADYWQEDPFWYRKPRGAKSPDDELMARAEAKYGDRGDYSHMGGNYPKKPAAPNPAAKGQATIDYTNDGAARKFNELAKENIIDYDSFHEAFDDALKAAGCQSTIFDSQGRLNNAKTWSKIKELDASLASVRALKKLWGLQFKSAAMTIEQARKKREQEKFYQHESDLLDAIRERVKAHPEIFDKDEHTERAKLTIEKQDDYPSTLDIGRSYKNNNGYICIDWKEDVNYDVCYGDSVTVRYPDVDNFMNTDVNTLADYFIDQIKNDDWRDGLGYHNFKDGTRDV